jgi:hypothetical protein
LKPIENWSISLNNDFFLSSRGFWLLFHMKKKM